MSAISGILRRDGGQVNSKLIKKMNNCLSHRGPDGSNIFLEGPLAMAHQMLHTTPESINENLPFKDENSGMVITTDARIDNRKELSTLLKLENCETVPDSAFILRAYQEWGENCPKNLLGDFAFAIWDPQIEKLFCARDHMGVKPFYYYISEDVICFSTEMKALINLPIIPKGVNELKIALFLMNNPTDRKLTFYENIMSLTAAHSLKINMDGHEICRYWKLDPELRLYMDSDEEYVERFREIFQEAIKCRMRSAFPMGYELSGGLDSSSIVSMSRKILKENNLSYPPLNTFAYDFDDIYKAERNYYIEKVRDTGGINLNLISANEINPLKDVKTILRYQEQPFHTPILTIVWDLYKKMEQQDIRIVFNGEGGDAIFALGRQNYFKELLKSFKLIKLLKEINDYSNRMNQNFINSLTKQIIFPLVPNSMKDGLFKLTGKNPINLLNNDFIHKVGGEDYLNQLTGALETETTRTYHYRQLTGSSFPYVHEMRDRVGAAFSIEIRYPFRDKRLVEFCYAVPDEIKFHHGWDRYLHRIAMEGIIPSEVQWRSLKHDFGPEFRRKTFISHKDFLEEFVFSTDRCIDPYIDIDKMKDIYQRINSEATPLESRLLWFSMILEWWFFENFGSQQ